MFGNALAADVVGFWREAGPRWFARDDAFDHEFRERFLALHYAAARGELASWEQSPEGVLGLLILLDQFPRNAFRGTGHMFATDGLALAIARRALVNGFDLKIEMQLRPFVYLPYEHAENLADQDECVRLMTQFGGETLRYAIVHRDVIAQFGRFPHRNASLGRDTSVAEQYFLDKGGFSG